MKLWRITNSNWLNILNMLHNGCQKVYTAEKDGKKNQDKWNYIHMKLMMHIVTTLFKYAPQFSSVAQSCPTLCDPMNRSTPGLPVHHQLPEFTQTHIHRVSDAIQPSHPLLTPFPPAPNPSQHQSLFQWVNSSHEVEMCYWWNYLIFLDHSFDI